MRTLLSILVSMVITAMPMKLVQADSSQDSAEQPVIDRPETGSVNTESGADKQAWAKSLFEGRCQMCHQLPEPSMLNAKQWRLVLGTMQHRMQQAGVPPLTAEETDMLVDYLVEQSR